MSEILCSRFAPTPSGYLHKGNAFSFLLTWLIVRKKGGRIGLRIDDLDGARRRPEYVEDIFRSLEWLGLDYDFGPETLDQFYQHYTQHKRIDRYQQLLDQLRQDGKLFVCRCSRREIQEQSKDGQYPGTCRELNLSPETPQTAWRIQTNSTVQTVLDFRVGSISIDLGRCMRDFVVRRKDGLPAYQIASLADDIDHEINWIVRGADLLPSSAAQLFLSEQLELSAFTKVTFYHHPLVTDKEGGKLSKSAGAASLKSLRESGKTPLAIYQQLAEWLQLSSQEIETLEELQAAVDLGKLPKVTLP